MRWYNNSYIIDPTSEDSKITVQDFINGITSHMNLGEFYLDGKSPRSKDGPYVLIRLFVTHARSHAYYYIFYDRNGIAYMKKQESGTGMNYKGPKETIIKENTFDFSKIDHIRSVSTEIRFDSDDNSIDMRRIVITINLRGIRMKKDLTLANLQYNVIEGLIPAVR